MFAEHERGACGQVEGQAFDTGGRVQRVGDGEVLDALVDVSEAAERRAVGAENSAVDTAGREDAGKW